MTHFSWLPDDATIMNMFMQREDRSVLLMGMAQNLLRKESEMSVGERELLAAFVSGVNACSFCYGSHTAVAEAFGIDANLLAALVADENHADGPERMRPILTMARKLTQTPSKVVASDIKAIVDAGWSEDTASDAIYICAFFNMMNRLLDGHGIKGSDAANAMSRKRLPGGYKMPWIIRKILKFRMN